MGGWRVRRGLAGAGLAGPVGAALLAFAAFAALVAVASSALAADKPIYGPAPAWVKQAELPAAAAEPPGDAAAVKVLLTDIQHRVGADGALETFSETAFRIGSPEGLQALGSLAFTWDPELETVTVHRMRVVRGGQVIDLLGGNGVAPMTVLRREANLDRAMLDGRLTAAIQPEGLQVGDVVDMAVTRRHLDPALMGRVQTVTGAPLTAPVAHMRIRVLWPRGRKVQWRGGLGLPPIRTAPTADGGEELLIEQFALEPVARPRSAPARYALIGALDLTDFADWAEVSSVEAPLWTKATTLKPGSPLKAEAARIAQAWGTPKLRAQAALRLVQEKVRYLFLGMNDGGYVPADADVTWQRLFGDCKGKTALLIALLHELGIQAEPAVVASALGDGLDQRAPMLAVFDHVIVRAVVEGKVYWLDGTRLGDINLDRLEVPPFKWALPIRPAGAALEKLTPAPLAEPDSEFILRLDASAGIDAPAPAHGEVIVRGDRAYQAKVMSDNMAAEQRNATLKTYWARRHDFIEVKQTGFTYDAQKGEARWTMEGVARMQWAALRTGGRRYEADGAGLALNGDFNRPAGPFADVPFAVASPSWTRTEETIVLPRGGAGFTVTGLQVDLTLAGFALKRTAAIAGGVFRLETQVRAVADEVPAATVRAQSPQIKALAQTSVYISAPAGYQPLPQEAQGGGQAGAPAQPGQDVAALVQQAVELVRKGDLDGAFALADQAVKADPASAQALALRGSLHLTRSRTAAAEADFNAAIKLDGANTLALDGLARIQMSRGDVQGALATTTLALAANPADPYAAALRAAAEIELKRYAEAEADIANALGIDPNMTLALVERAQLRFQQERWDEALADADAIIRTEPDTAIAHLIKAAVLERKSDLKGALAALDKAVALAPGDGVARRERGRVHARSGELEAARVDLIAALEVSPRDIASYQLIARVLIQLDDGAGALAQVERGLQVAPGSPDLLALRAEVLARLRRGEEALKAMDEAERRGARPIAYVLRAEALAAAGRMAEAIRLFDREVAAAPTSPDPLNNRCLFRALHDEGLQAAAADCDGAIRLGKEPQLGQYYDSRGLLNLKLRRWPAALADYDEAIRRFPRAASSLYGRGLAKLRLGDAKGAAADFAAAKALNPRSEATFAAWGLRP